MSVKRPTVACDERDLSYTDKVPPGDGGHSRRVLELALRAPLTLRVAVAQEQS